MTEGTISEWLVQTGEQVIQGDPIVGLETDKVNIEVNSDYTGVLAEILFEEGEDVEVGDDTAKVDESAEAGATPTEETPSGEAAEPAKAEAEEPATAAVESDATPEVVASTAARKRARELNIDLNTLQPRDPLGRIRPEDEIGRAHV